jgi:hypothetical protein
VVSATDRALDELIAGKWVLTTEQTADGTTAIVAYRPIGWTGPGDPHERLQAPTHARMRCLLARRHRQGRP